VGTALAGGVAAKIGGGKFATGAALAGFGYVFNNGVGWIEFDPTAYLKDLYKELGLTIASIAVPEFFVVRAGATVAAANVAREVAVGEMFASSTAQKISEAFGWKTGLPGTQEAMKALNADRVAKVAVAFTKAEVESISKAYQAVALSERSNPVAVARFEYIQEVLKRWSSR
jgi:hypothetical protein